jgi:transcriptional regulator with XRE-family HTH domain
MAIFEFIKNLRESKGFTQTDIAKHLGCTRQTYTQIENGNRDVTLNESRKLAALFGISIESFVTEQAGGPCHIELEAKPSKKRNKQEIRISVPQNKVAKFKEVLLYILEKVGAQPNVGQTVLYKLLYFIDFDYYEKYEEQFIGARYQKNHFGPTPIEFKKIASDMIQNQEIEEVKSKYFTREQLKYLPHRSANLEKLTAREIKHIDEVLARLAQKNAKELSEYSHQDVPWIMAEDGEEIKYEAVFYRTHETTVRNYGDD